MEVQGVSELRRLRQLEDENNRLKQIVADLTLDKQRLQDVLKKIFESAETEKQLVEQLMDQYRAALRRACRTLALH
jgi:DNA-binding transcriptional regulator YbjK